MHCVLVRPRWLLFVSLWLACSLSHRLHSAGGGNGGVTLNQEQYDDLMRRLHAVERAGVQDLTGATPARQTRVTDLRTVNLDTWTLATVIQRHAGPAPVGPMRIDTGAGYGGGELCFIKGAQHMSMGSMLGGDDWMFLHAVQASTNTINAQLSDTVLAPMRNANMSIDAVVSKLVNPVGAVKVLDMTDLRRLAANTVRRYAAWHLVHRDLVLTLEDGFLQRFADEVARCGLGDGLKVMPLPPGREGMWRAVVTFVESGIRAVHSRLVLSDGKSFDTTFMYEGGYVWPRDGTEWTEFKGRITPRAALVQPAPPAQERPAAAPRQAGGAVRGRREHDGERAPRAPQQRYEPYVRPEVSPAVREFCKQNDVCVHFQRGPRECRFQNCKFAHRVVTAADLRAAEPRA